MAKPLEKQRLTAEEPHEKVRHVAISEDFAGVRLDKFLAQEYPQVPRTRIYRIVRKGEVRVNAKRSSIDYRLIAGDDVRLPPVRAEAPAEAEAVAAAAAAAGTSGSGGPAGQGGARTVPAVRATRVPKGILEAVTQSIIHEDQRLIVVNKPAGIAVHGGSGISCGVIEALRAARPDEKEKLELVHRLDRDTSGVLLVARKPAVLRALHATLREGEGMEKRYLALVKGSWQLGKKRVDAPLRTDLRVGGERTVKVQPAGKSAISDFRPVQFFGRLATLMEVQILTGRTHQIRVHAAYAGHPVAGDEKYGDEEFNEEMKDVGLRRMFLHASSLSFTWPDTGMEFSVNAPLPPELAAVIDAIGPVPGGRRRSAVRRRPR
jgi:23S rRNA pseudouridine955/2504/2580 synthase